jgi:hypothetical protein
LLLWTLNEGVHKPMPASDDGIASFDCILIGGMTPALPVRLFDLIG